MSELRRLSALMPTTMADGIGYDAAGNCDRLLCEGDRQMIDAGLYPRVGGDAPCPVCGSPYRLHPPVQGALWLTRGCDGLGR